MSKGGYVYIMSNYNRTTLYIGVTSNIERRVLEHKAGSGSGFTSKYKLTDLLYTESVPGIEEAIAREKQASRLETELDKTRESVAVRSS